MRYFVPLFALLLIPLLISADEPPKLLYKITTEKLWKKSQDLDELMLSKRDKRFIHLAEEEDVDRIIKKYFPDENRVVILTLETSALKGKIVKEVNPGGKRLYYHLYNGSIPFDAIVAVKIVSIESTD